MKSAVDKLNFWISAKRIGPDMPLTHWMLFFKVTMTWLAKKKLARLGKDSEIRPGSYLIETQNVEIGERVVIRPNTMLMADEYAKIIIGDDVLIGAGVHMYVNDHKFDDLTKNIAEQGYFPSKNVMVSNNVWIGANAIILAGVKIGTHSVIAAGSVVTKSVDPFCVYAGVPAKKIKHLKA